MSKLQVVLLSNDLALCCVPMMQHSMGEKENDNMTLMLLCISFASFFFFYLRDDECHHPHDHILVSGLNP